MQYDADVVDLDHPEVLDEDHARESVTVCSCGERRSTVRHLYVSRCAGMALARLKAAHQAEYAQYLAELKQEALVEFDVKWRGHLAGDHRP